MSQKTRNLKESAIDFVIPWVDGNDPEWRREKNMYSGNNTSFSSEKDIRDERYRDWDNLQYWFRGVEKFAPWLVCKQVRISVKFGSCAKYSPSFFLIRFSGRHFVWNA